MRVKQTKKKQTSEDWRDERTEFEQGRTQNHGGGIFYKCKQQNLDQLQFVHLKTKRKTV